MLVDKSDDISRLHTGSNKEIKKTALFNWISDCEREGRAMTQQSGADAIMQRMSLILMHQECLTTAHKDD